ncbi:hypothetical protein [Winogradskyella vincentii]|uniref:Uncharacterized protein n=1 Tax=Winogradskyella vincentii TaxID=2877122 RepID=A0ABS7Y2Z4_9FLAO|nr:hypothetical protein [Winogradskyella vincentii]MCA0153710.1 hypothetical protein [Winogradskyella vincentii]
MARKTHVAIIVPDGVGIKNYLYSDLLRLLSEHSEITLWSPLPEQAFEEVKQVHSEIRLNYKPLQIHKESILTRVFRESATYARLHFFKNKTENETLLLNWRKPKSFKQKLLYGIAELVGNWAKSDYKKILKLEQLSKKYWSDSIIKFYKSQLKDLKASSVFITHQRVAGLMPICLASKEMDIKSVSAIFSWDNLPKARLCVSTDYYALWSNLMAEDMRLFYPEIGQEQLKVVGTPQFEFYTQEYRLIDRKTFANTYGLDYDKKWICFSGDDELTSPYDPNYLRNIAEVIAQYNEDVQILFRRCPVDFSERYNVVLEEFKDVIISIDPIWHTESSSWVGYFSKYKDIDLQVNLAHHCEGVINLGSTMALDFASLNKPCFYLNYDTEIDANWSTNFIYKYHHFGSLNGLDPVGWINGKDEIASAISSILNGSQKRLLESQKWMERIVQFPIDENSKKLSKLLV